MEYEEATLAPLKYPVKVTDNGQTYEIQVNGTTLRAADNKVQEIANRYWYA
jgi:phosphoribosylformylglycinamidine (FGAM) synthase PurS component